MGGAAGEPCGTPGAALVVTGGNVAITPGSSHGLEISGPVREGETVTATITGAPGDPVCLLFSKAPGDPVRGPRWDGPVLIASPQGSVAAGTIGASGTRVLTAPAPALPPGAEFRVWYCQAFVLDAAAGRFVVSAPATLVVLDESL